MKAFKETEKAVLLKLCVEYHAYERTRSYMVWVPKTQLDENGIPREWITRVKVDECQEICYGSCSFDSWEDADGASCSYGKSQADIAREKAQEEAFKKGCEEYKALVAKAKAMGIKGVREGLKKATILAKIEKAVMA